MKHEFQNITNKLSEVLDGFYNKNIELQNLIALNNLTGKGIFGDDKTILKRKEKLQLEKELFKSKFNSLFKEAFDTSNQNDFEWTFSSFKTYKVNSTEKLRRFQTYNIDNELIDFLQRERFILRQKASPEKGFLKNRNEFIHPYDNKPYIASSFYYYKKKIDLIISKENLEQIQISESKKIEYIEKQIDNYNNPKAHIETNRHDHIFSKNGFTLFEHILETYIRKPNERGYQSDIIYFYWRLFNDNYIHKRPVPFLEWFNDEFEEEINQTKTLNQVKNPSRDRHYSSALNWFKSNHQ